MFRRIRHGAARRRVIPGAESPPATPARHALRLVCEDLSLGAPRPEDEDEASAILSDTLIQAPAGRLTEETLTAVDAWLAPRAAPGRQPAELRDATAVSIRGARVLVWRGDIRTLRVGAIVNAANEGGLGCFRPDHVCVDNLVHRAAGPRLRDACAAAMATRKNSLWAGAQPILTPAFHLPSDAVLHVTGPHVTTAAPTPADARRLASAYRLSLEAAMASGLPSVAFPCISTGLFGYPQRAAAKVALETTLDWLRGRGAGALEYVVFDTFTSEDHDIYREMLPLLARA
mmetsp:Transcript_19188/g.60061  ORF Transcript_19188/g.60061 Transcript_19188/m.60061 type:complete len:288 (-) Transcript_19188:24-887(-)